jgi:hypothetical protein
MYVYCILPSVYTVQELHNMSRANLDTQRRHDIGRSDMQIKRPDPVATVVSNCFTKGTSRTYERKPFVSLPRLVRSSRDGKRNSGL